MAKFKACEIHNELTVIPEMCIYTINTEENKGMKYNSVLTFAVISLC